MEFKKAETLTREVITQYYKFVGQQDIDGAVELFAEDVTWRIPGNNRQATWIKDRNSKEEVRSFFHELK